MPTPSGEKSVQDCIDIGKPFVTASGVANVLYHEGGCYPLDEGRCTCGCAQAMTRLALAFDTAITEFGRVAGQEAGT